MASPEFEGNAPYPAPPPDAEPDEVVAGDMHAEAEDNVVKELPDVEK